VQEELSCEGSWLDEAEVEAEAVRSQARFDYSAASVQIVGRAECVDHACCCHFPSLVPLLHFYSVPPSSFSLVLCDVVVQWLSHLHSTLERSD